VVFGQPVEITREGDSYKIPSYGATLKLDGDRLEGTFLRLNYPMKLRRAKSLPSEKPMPVLPKGPAPL